MQKSFCISLFFYQNSAFAHHLPPLWGGNTHISQNSILWESSFDSFSLEGEAFGGNLNLLRQNEQR